MTLLIRLLFIISLLFVVGCSEQPDSQISGGEFTVHFSNPEDKELAKKIVHFWKDEDLMTGKNQDIKLVRSESGYDLYLIAPKRKSMAEMSFEEIQSLTALKYRLEEAVFKKDPVRIVITDDSFKPIFVPKL